MVKVKKEKKIVSSRRSDREGSVESTTSEGGSIIDDREGNGLRDSMESTMGYLPDNIPELEPEITDDSSCDENDVNVESKTTPKTNSQSTPKTNSQSTPKANTPVAPKTNTTATPKAGDGAGACTDSTENSTLGRKSLACYILVSAALVGLLSASTYYYYKPPTIQNPSNNDPVQQLEKTIFREIRKNFPTQEKELWMNFFSSIKHVNESKPTRPAIFFLLDNNSGKVANCLAWKIGNAASNFFKTPGMIEIPSEDAKGYINNELITLYRDDLKTKGVMIVYRLDQLSGLVAKSLHSFCDTYNPLVNRAVLLFTFNNRYANETLKANKKAQELMKALWKDTLMDSTLDALITRLTDSVFEIKSEEHIPCTESV